MSDLERIVTEPTAWSGNSEEGVVLSWLGSGRIAHDRTGRLTRAQVVAKNAPPPVPNEREAYDAWQKIGYNVAQLRRYAAASDPTSQIAVDLRLLYSLSEVAPAYFISRGMPWRGEKAAIRHWQGHDPAFLDQLRSCLAEPCRAQKVACYEELAQWALAPIGGLWTTGTTVVSCGAGYGASGVPPPGTIETAIDFWQDLIAGERHTKAG